MRRGKPGRWTLEASSQESAEQKAQAAGVTLCRIDPIGQITSAAVAFALCPGTRSAEALPRRTVGWIAACVACAAFSGAGGYLLGSHFARTAPPATQVIEQVSKGHSPSK